jgi:hypothetical protein
LIFNCEAPGVLLEEPPVHFIVEIGSDESNSVGFAYAEVASVSLENPREQDPTMFLIDSDATGV